MGASRSAFLIPHRHRRHPDVLTTGRRRIRLPRHEVPAVRRPVRDDHEEHAPLERSRDGHRVWLQCSGCFHDRLVQAAARVHWVIGVNLLFMTLMLSLPGTCCRGPAIGLGLHRRTNMGRATPLLGPRDRSPTDRREPLVIMPAALLTAGRLVGAATLLRFTCFTAFSFPSSRRC